ncbi:MAG: hypothetical protein AAGD32_15895 [Planctomycetota bacterium]
MKNATQHATALKALQKKLVKAHKSTLPKPGEKPALMKPLAALVWAAYLADAPEAKAEKALEQIHEHFVDYNDMRVATELEMIELLGSRYPKLEERLARLHDTLNMIFERESGLNLDRFEALKVKEKRELLRDLPGMTPFVEGYVMLYSADAAAFPIDEAMHGLLLATGAIEEDADAWDAQKFVEQQLKADELHLFFTALRAESQANPAKKKPARRKTA